MTKRELEKLIEQAKKTIEEAMKMEEPTQEMKNQACQKLKQKALLGDKIAEDLYERKCIQRRKKKIKKAG